MDSMPRLVQVMYVAYLGAALVMVALMIPGVRQAAATGLRQQATAWRYGRWLGSRTPPPGWTQALTRAELPDEDWSL